jgi:hypothetical protein
MKYLLLPVMFLFAETVLCWSGDYPLYSDDITFYQSFDDGKEADVSCGKSMPINVFGQLKFVPGIRGKALLCGVSGGALRYFRKGNFEPGKPFTIVLFYQAQEWENETNLPRWFLWAIDSNQGYIGLQGANDPKTICMCERPFHYMLLYGSRVPNKVLEFPKIGKAACSGWHMLALSVSGSEVRLKWDNRQSQKRDQQLTLTSEDFPADYFTIGCAGHWKYLLDEFIVYKRTLSDEELDAIFNTVMEAK